MERFYQALQSLLPSGLAWPRDPGSVWMRVLRGMAGALAELDAFITSVVQQWQPHLTVNRLAEWEEATGLPDTCFGTSQTDLLRRKLLLQRLRGVQLLFEDGSPAAIGALVRIAAEIGYPISVAYNTPFRVGDRVASRLGALDGQLYISVAIAANRFRVGDRVGKRLLEGALNGSELVCFLSRILPARFNPVFTYI